MGKKTKQRTSGFSPASAFTGTFFSTFLIESGLFPVQCGNFLPSLVLLLQNVVDSMFRPVDSIPPDEGDGSVDVVQVHETLVNLNSIVASVLHDFSIVHASTLLDQGLICHSQS